jgi:hypothetical protein
MLVLSGVRGIPTISIAYARRFADWWGKCDGEPLYPATLDGSDEFVARITPPAIEFVHLDEAITTHFSNPNSSFEPSRPRALREPLPLGDRLVLV